MSEKKNTVKSLVDDAISNNKEAEVKRIKANFRPILVGIPSFTAPSGFKNREFRYDYQFFTSYPPSLTDQTHALTLAQQVRRGQGDADKPDPKAFDFPDGKDDGSQAHGIFEFAERVDSWIAEQNLSAELKADFRQQVLNSALIQQQKEQSSTVSNKKQEQPSTPVKEPESK